MATATYRMFDPLLPRAQAERMLRVCERFGAYGMYSQEASEAEIGQGLFPAPRRRDELPQDRWAVRPARLDRVARRTHELLSRELRLRRRGAHRRHRALPALRGLRPGGARDPRPAGGRARDRVREPPRPGAGAGRAHRGAGVPWREPEALPAVAHGRHAPF